MTKSLSRYIVLDIETISECNLRTAGCWVYAEHPTTQVFTWKGYHSEDGFVDDLSLYAADPQLIWVAHNAQFERAIWKHHFSLPLPPISRWVDTQALCAIYGLPLDLDGAGRFLGIGEKSKDGKKALAAINKHVLAGLNPMDLTAEVAKVEEYCRQDVLLTNQLYLRLPMQESVRRFWCHYMQMLETGLRLDTTLIGLIWDRLTSRSLKLAQKAINLMGCNVTQRDKTLAWLRSRGCNMPDLTDKAVDLALKTAKGKAREILLIRKELAKTSLKKLDRMIATLCKDGRSRGLLQFNGALPGRSAGRLWQPQNLPRPTYKINGEYPEPNALIARIKEDDKLPFEAYRQAIRHAIIPSEGYSFVSGDFVGIQLRVLLALAGQYDKCDMLANGLNLYEDMGRAIFGRKIDKHNDVFEYTIAKNAVLGLGFGMGHRTFGAKYGEGLRPDFLERIVQTYRRNWAPKVPRLWQALNNAAVEAVRTGKAMAVRGVTFLARNIRGTDYLIAKLPSGRCIFYPHPKVITSGYYQNFVRYMSPRGPVDTFGGMLTENIVMAIEVDILREAAMRVVENHGYRWVLDVHDELLFEADDRWLSKAEEDIKLAMEDVSDWTKKLKIPIAVETWTGKRYKK